MGQLITGFAVLGSGLNVGLPVIRLFGLLTLLSLSGCALRSPVPELDYVASLPPATTGLPAQLNRQFQQQHAETQENIIPPSGARLLTSGEDALLYRLALIDQAVSSIDLQYFIWSADTSGTLLFDRVMQAADRGVKVRMLVDDIDLAATDTELATLSEHPNLSVRIYNPSWTRNTAGKINEWAINYRQLNRRMHNKLLVVDGHVAVVGGRNIGDSYYGLNQHYNFVDLDVMVTGGIMPDLSHAFDKYWNSRLAVPGETLTRKRINGGPVAVHQIDRARLSQERALWVSYRNTPAQNIERLQQLEGQWQTIETVFLQEAPESLGKDEFRLIDLLSQLAGPSEQELLISSPYLIPRSSLLDDLTEFSEQGVTVKVITNSLGSNNHIAAHSHYKKYRRDLLKTGLELYEFDYAPSQALTDHTNVSPVNSQFLSLHTKAIVSDREICFIGSLNLDPRAVEINSENGLLIRSPELCGELADKLLRLMEPDNSWQVEIDEQGLLRWYGEQDGKPESLSLQPSRKFHHRLQDGFFRLLPLENQI